jgi:hypothetical protein
VRRWRDTFFVFLIVLLVSPGCRKDRPSTTLPKSAPVVEEPAPLDPRVDPDARGEDRGPDTSDPDDPPYTTACEAYMACCHAYMDSMLQIPGMDPTTLASAHEGCDALEDVAHTPEAQEGCMQAMDGMRQAIESMVDSIPGYVVPAACL